MAPKKPSPRKRADKRSSREEDGAAPPPPPEDDAGAAPAPSEVADDAPPPPETAREQSGKPKASRRHDPLGMTKHEERCAKETLTNHMLEKKGLSHGDPRARFRRARKAALESWAGNTIEVDEDLDALVERDERGRRAAAPREHRAMV